MTRVRRATWTDSVLVTLALSTVACGAASTPAPSPTASASPAPAAVAGPRETEACAADRAAILATMAASRDAAACASATDCAVVTGPGHPDPEYAEVVAARDAGALDARAEAHLASCGAFHHDEALSAFRVIEAECERGRCTALETTFHAEE